MYTTDRQIDRRQTLGAHHRGHNNHNNIVLNRITPFRIVSVHSPGAADDGAVGSER